MSNSRDTTPLTFPLVCVVIEVWELTGNREQTSGNRDRKRYSNPERDREQGGNNKAFYQD